MASIEIRPDLLPATVDWTAWAQAGIVGVQLPPTEQTDSHAPIGLEDTGLKLGYVMAPAPLGPLGPLLSLGERAASADASVTAPPRGQRWGAVVAGLPSESRLLDRLGTRIGHAVLSPLDCFATSLRLHRETVRAAVAAAGGDPERAAASVDRYLRAREAGSAPAVLDGDQDAIAMLLGEDAEAVLASRCQATSMDARRQVALLRAAGAESVTLEIDARAAVAGMLIGELANAAEDVIVRVQGDLTELLRQARGAVEAGAVGVVVRAPTAHIPNTERLADALDLCEGAGAHRFVIATDAAWFATGARSVARAAHRLRGRPWRLDDERERRWETVRI